LDPEIYTDMREAHKIGNAIEYTDLQSIVNDWGIYYDPDVKDTIIDEDKELVELYQDFIDVEGMEDVNAV
jgi:hypothetical protein